ncbi:MAG TPA: 50S ribosomal protein L4 [Tepidisphaeraceae bacterium]|nr:50S ribosomal protein L4 [Tepidisphaeraceae bacterium]
MLEIPVFDQSGQKVESLQVDEARFGGTVRVNLLKQALVMYHANKRQGTVQTQARGEVAGSTRKIFRQKGTGNARMGTIRQPVRRGGGHAKQKRPKEWRLALPKKARRLARDSAILSKIKSNDIRVISSIELPAAKTKHMAQIFKALGIDRSCLFALVEKDQNIERSARNLDRTRLTTVSQLNAWDLLNTRTLLITKAGFEKLLAN